MHAYSVDDGETTSVPAFQIRWEEDDLSLLETHPLTPEAAATGDVDSDTTDDGPLRRPSGRLDDEDTVNSGLPTGAIAGIVVGVTFFVDIVLISGFIWYRKRYLKGAKASAQGVEGDREGDGKPETTASQLVNPAGLPPIYPGVPQEMEASHQFAPPGIIQDGTVKHPAEVQAIPSFVYNPAVQQLDGVAAPPQGVPVSHATNGSLPVASELYSYTTRPSELGPSTNLTAGTHPLELHGVDRVAGRSPAAATERTHQSHVVAEMQASTIQPTELASG